MANIGFIGLGNMGLPMAKNLIAAGHNVTGFDLSADAMAALSDAGGTGGGDAAAASADADFVITMLPAGTHVRDVYENSILGAAKSDALLIDCSTIDVETAREVAETASSKGFEMLDAPVSGGTGGAEAGTLTFMVGGPDSAYIKGHPVLEVMGKTIVHAGGAGNGQAAKICNNMILGISMIATCEAFAMAEKLGLDHQKLFDISSKSSGQCWSISNYCPVPGPVPAAPSNRDYEPGFSAAMMLKDLRLAQDAAKSSQSATPLGAEAEKLFSAFVEQGSGGKDFSGIIRMISGN